MSLDKLLERIATDARAEGEEILAQAGEEAARILREGEEEALRSAEDIRSSYRRRGERERTRIMSEALAEGRAAYLSTQEELFEEALAAAAREFESLPEERYRAWLKKVILEHAGEGVDEIIAASYDRSLLAGGLLDEVNAALRERGTQKGLVLSDREADFDRGVILRGDKYANNLSVQALLREVRERREEEILDILFGEREKEAEKRGKGE